MNEAGEKEGLVPKLRFPGFLGNWDNVTIDEACDVLNNLRKPVTSDNRKVGKYPYYGASGIVDYVDEWIFDEPLILVGEDGAKWEAGEETAFEATGRYWVNNHAHVLRAKTAEPRLIVTQLVRRDLSPFVTGAAPPKLTLGRLRGVSILLPSNEDEQRKIAKCLQSLDELIGAETEKLEALKRHKKGLLQQLFPAEGETIPRLRFPQFRQSAEWVTARLGDVCVRIMDGTHFSPKSTQGEFMYITSKNIQNGYLDLSNLSFISRSEHEVIYKRCPVRRNDVLLTKDGANTGNCAINTLDTPFSLLSSVAVIRGQAKLIDQSFIYFSLLTDFMQGRLRGSMSGQAITRITLEKINGFEICIPGLVEQEHIASCLHEVSSAEGATERLLDGYRSHKAALMQKLFPSLDEIEQ